MKISFWLKIVFFVVVFFSTFAFYSRIVFGASITIDAVSLGNVLNGVNSFSSGGFNFSSMNPALLPATYDSINQYLYSNFGYDVNDAIDFGSDNLTGWATGQVDNPLNSSDMLPSVTTNFVANTMKAGLTAQALLENGYQYFAQRVPQWGENAKQFFIGKVDDVSGAISDIGDGFVTKVTTQGLLAYNQIYNNLVSDGNIINNTSNGYMIGQTFSFNDLDGVYYSLRFNKPVLITSNPEISSHQLAIYNPFNASVSGNVVQNGQLYSIDMYSVYGGDFNVYVNGVDHIFNYFTLISHDSGTLAFRPKLDTILSPWDFDFSLLGDNTTYSYNYGSSSLPLALKSQLDRLIGAYVDSLTLQRINDIVNSIPIGREVVDDVSVPVAIPTQAIVDELTGIIDQAIEDSVIYDTVFDAYYDDAIDVPAEPEPPTDDEPDIYVPIDVPINPISAVGSALTIPYMFSSVFEPIFLAFGGGLFSLWLFVPTLIIFVAIIWALK